jgi:hypothetical protein
MNANYNKYVYMLNTKARIQTAKQASQVISSREKTVSTFYNSRLFDTYT